MTDNPTANDRVAELEAVVGELRRHLDAALDVARSRTAPPSDDLIDRIAGRLLCFWALSPSMVSTTITLDDDELPADPQLRRMICDATGATPDQLHAALLVLVERGHVRIHTVAPAAGIVPFLAATLFAGSGSTNDPDTR